MRTDRPCLDCPDRRVGCHDGCEREQAWKDEHDARREKIFQARAMNAMLDNFVTDGIRRSKRGRRRK